MAGRATKTRYYARRPMTYDGTDYSRGQVIELIGARNDEKLIRMGYVGEIEPKAETYTHADTGAEFIGIAERDAYGNRLRRRENLQRYGELTPEQEDRLAEEEMKEAEPLHI